MECKFLLCVSLSSDEMVSLICRGEVLPLLLTNRDDDSSSTSWRCAAANSISMILFIDIFLSLSISVLFSFHV